MPPPHKPSVLCARRTRYLALRRCTTHTHTYLKQGQPRPRVPPTPTRTARALRPSEAAAAPRRSSSLSAAPRYGRARGRGGAGSAPHILAHLRPARPLRSARRGTQCGLPPPLGDRARPERFGGASARSEPPARARCPRRWIHAPDPDDPDRCPVPQPRTPHRPSAARTNLTPALPNSLFYWLAARGGGTSTPFNQWEAGKGGRQRLVERSALERAG